MQHPAARTVVSLLLFACLGLPACGGSSGGGGGGGGGAGVPTLTLVAPTLGVAGILGDTFTLTFVSNDDGSTPVTLLADADLNLATTMDQTPLYVGVDGDGAQQSVPVTLAAPLGVGDYTLVLRIDDGVNPAVQIVLPRPLTIYPGVAGVAIPSSNRYGVVGNTVVFSRGEAEDGAGALNGDGLADDGVMVLLDAATGVLTQPTPSVSMDVTGLAGGQVRPVITGAGTLAWLTLEADENLSLNAGNVQSPVAPVGGADLDGADAMISFVVPGLFTNPRTNTYGGAGGILRIENGLILAPWLEAGEGNPGGGTDLNTDGDVLDAFLGYVDPAAPGPPYEYNQVVFFRAPPLPAVSPVVAGANTGRAAYLVSEIGAPPGTDMNGDGDGADAFLALADYSQPGGAGAPGAFLAYAGFQGAPTPKPASSLDAAAAFDLDASGHAGYYVDETATNHAPGGLVGNDLNGDGILGRVAMLYDVTTNTEILPASISGPLNSAPGSPTMVADGTRFFFTALEGARIDPAPGTNGDGDGGTDLAILYWTDHSAGPIPPAQPLAVNFGGALTLQALSLDGGGSVTRLAAGWLAVIVNEAANGFQDINSSGVVDNAYLLVDASTAPAPTVYNPKIVPSTAGTIPLAGVYGEDPGNADQGVVVRLTEAQNGDLDGDGNGTETFLAYVSFNTPTMPVRLDAGGDHVAVKDGLIAVTASETLTNEDYDGNGAFADHVFRVLDFQGNVIEAGKLCSNHSVPVTTSGQVWLWLRDEAVEGRFLNGDGDQMDRVLGIWVP